MKQKDIALLILVAVFSAVVSFVISGYIFAPDSAKSQKSEVVEAIEPQFNELNSKYFNATTSINPTKRIQIGDNTNPAPFVGE